MKKLKNLLALMLVLALALSFTGCFVISGQKMNKLKGTYKLTTYTYTPTYERKEGYTPKTFDYVNDAEYKYEDYLVITGTDKGYYVHKEASGESYVKEVTLSYEYSEDNTSKVEYVVFNDSVTVNSDESGLNRLGVAKNNLNFSKSGIDFTQLITKKPMHSESLSIRWEKVSKATDLSYVNSQLGDIKYYSYDAFAKRGIYELNTYVDTETLEHLLPYQYFYIVIDTANGINTATMYYMDSPEEGADLPEQVKRTVSFSVNGDYSIMTIDGTEWKADVQFGGSYYYCIKDNFKITVRLASNDLSDANIEYLINNKLPVKAD